MRNAAIGLIRVARPAGSQVELHDLRFATRQLIRAPWFTIAAVLVLTPGIGANIAVFSLVHTTLVAPRWTRSRSRIYEWDASTRAFGFNDLPARRYSRALTVHLHLKTNPAITVPCYCLQLPLTYPTFSEPRSYFLCSAELPILCQRGFPVP